MGVGSCSSSNCHGNTNPRLSSDILHNEFVTWFKHDKHARSYKVLFESDAKKIATNMGLGDPEKEKYCLDCHALNVPKSRQGEKFYVEDGVSCEKCHGAAERWLASHADASATHAKNVSNGMVDLINLSTRVNLCAGCHFGSSDTVATHKLIGSGHPRLTFDLDTFEAVQPRHWKLDADYAKRKEPYDATAGWLITQVTLAEKTLEKISNAHSTEQDLSTYYCYSCHHSLAEEQWKKRSYDGKAGVLRLNDSNFVLLEKALKDLYPDGTAMMADARKSLESSGLTQQAITEIAVNLKKVRVHIREIDKTESTTKTLLGALISYGSSGAVVDYQVADQIAMGIETLGGKNTGPLFTALKASYAFDPESFKRAVSRIK